MDFTSPETEYMTGAFVSYVESGSSFTYQNITFNQNNERTMYGPCPAGGASLGTISGTDVTCPDLTTIDVTNVDA